MSSLRGLPYRACAGPEFACDSIPKGDWMPINPPHELEFAACVGLDWADQQHVICLQATGHANTESGQLEQKPDTLHDWVAQLRTRFQGRRVAIAIEQSRGAVIHALMRYDFLARCTRL